MSISAMVEVQSSTIKAFGYDTSSEELLVNFKNGKTYLYTNVPKKVVEELRAAESKGSYFSFNIRNVFNYRELSEAEVTIRLSAQISTSLRDLIAGIGGGLPVFQF